MIALEEWFQSRPDFNPWSPARYLFREKLRELRAAQWPPSDHRHVRSICALPPRSPSDGSVSTDKSEDLRAMKVHNRLHIFVKAANSPASGSVSRVPALLDSGAEPNCVSEELANKAGSVLKLGPKTLLSADGKTMEAVGDVKLNVAWLNGEDISHAKISCLVVRGLQDDIVLSEQTICRHGLREIAASSLDPVPTSFSGTNVSPIKLGRQSKCKAEEDVFQLKEKRDQAIAREKVEAGKRALQRSQMAAASPSSQSSNCAVTVNSGGLNASTSISAIPQMTSSNRTSVTSPASVPSSPQSAGKP